MVANLRFEYTKLRPLREKITEKQSHLREIEKIVAHLQLGGEGVDAEWFEDVKKSNIFSKLSEQSVEAFQDLSKEFDDT